MDMVNSFAAIMLTNKCIFTTRKERVIYQISRIKYLIELLIFGLISQVLNLLDWIKSIN